MIFANPLWFLLFVPLGFWFYQQWKSPNAKRVALPYSDLNLLKGFIQSQFFWDKTLFILKVLSWVLLVIALARPQLVSTTKEPPRPVVDIFLCLDTSLSMGALDFDPENRLEAAKKAAETFIKKRTFDRIGLIIFGGRAITQCPLTLDHETLIEFLRSVPLNATQTDGTAVGTALALAAARLSESEAKTKIIILLTDGRNNTGNIDPLTAASAANELGIKIYTIGTAVPGGGLLPVDDPIFGRRVVKMVEDLDENTLLEIAGRTGAKYFRVTSAHRFKEIYAEIDSMEKTKIEVGQTKEFRDFYSLFLMIALFLIFSEIFLRSTVWRTVP